MKLSFIVPIYNTEPFILERCFESINCIEKLEYECILIDDGSKGEIGEFCADYSYNHKRFKYFRKKNGGVSSARNEGIRKAKGEYIYFVDSDDTIITDVFDQFVHGYENADLVFTDLILVDGQHKCRWGNMLGTTYDMVLKRLIMDGKINGPYAKFWKKDFLERNGLLFDETMVSGEDALFLLSFLCCNPKMMYANVDTYLYYKESKSGDNRISMYPYICIQDCEKKYKKILECIECGNYEKKEKVELMIQEAEQLIHELFGLEMSMISVNVWDSKANFKFTEIIENIDGDLCEKVNKISKLKLGIMKSEQVKMKQIFSDFRRIYLKIKGLR